MYNGIDEIAWSKCDRCGQIFEVPHLDFRKYSISDGSSKILLCADCYRFFESWISNSDKKQESQKENKSILCNDCRNRVYCMMDYNASVKTHGYFCDCYEKED